MNFGKIGYVFMQLVTTQFDLVIKLQNLYSETEKVAYLNISLWICNTIVT